MLIALAGASYQAVSNYLDSRHWPEMGRLVEANGIKMQIHCTGRGSPTVILEAGLGDILTEWKHLQPAIAKHTRVCSYDRAGYGRSDPGILPRISRQIAIELHTLLNNAGEAPPFILVGHSFGGYNVRLYNALFPNQVAGVILVDSTQEDQYALLPPAWKALSVQQLKRYQRQATWAPVFVGLGIARLTLRAQMDGILDENAYLILQSKYVKTRASEAEFIEVSAEQARSAGSVGNKPLIILTAGKQDDSEFHRIWVNELQPRLEGLSTHSERIIVADSGHDMPTEKPEAIISAVERLLRELEQRSRN